MESNEGFGESSNNGSFGEGTGASSTSGYSAGSAAASPSGTEQEATSKLQQGKDAAASALGTVKDRAVDLKAKAGDLASTAKDKAADLKATLADKLDAGADALRNRTQGTSLTPATAEGTIAASATDDSRMAQVNEALASGMQSTAKFLREGDLQAAIEDQVKNHPTRSLLVALGVGYLAGKALRK